MSQVSTLTFFKYKGFKRKLKGFGFMQTMPKKLKKVKGQEFFKLMGSGKAGFNPSPDWSVYALLQTWENEESADNFFQNSEVKHKFFEVASNTAILYMHSVSSKGSWSGVNPFKRNKNITLEQSKIAVITRATIKKRSLLKFWKYVPTSQKSLQDNEGLIYTKGIGEVPIIQMATFSLWENKAALLKYAYQSEGHKNAIKKTKELNWYKEELFARFQPYKIIGSLEEF